MKRSAQTHRSALAERTRAALMSAATEAFAARGFDGATLDDIARAAGVNKALIAYHFGGKRGLYAAILAATFDRLNRALDAALPHAAGSDARLRAAIRVFARLHVNSPRTSAMLLREAISGGAHLDDEVLPHFLGVFARVRRQVAEGIRDGSFREVNPLLMHLSILGGLAFFFASAPLRSRLIAEGKVPFPEPSAEEFIEHFEALMSRGLAAPPRTPRGGRG
jgi:TetR/AcrR family transcriptional regulator